MNHKKRSTKSRKKTYTVRLDNRLSGEILRVRQLRSTSIGRLVTISSVFDELVELGAREMYKTGGLMPDIPCTYADPSDTPQSLCSLIRNWHVWLAGRGFVDRYMHFGGTNEQAVVSRKMSPSSGTFEHLTITRDNITKIIKGFDEFINTELSNNKPLPRPRSHIERNDKLQNLWDAIGTTCPTSIRGMQMSDVLVENFEDPIGRVSQETYLGFDSCPFGQLNADEDTEVSDMDEYYAQLLKEEENS